MQIKLLPALKESLISMDIIMQLPDIFQKESSAVMSLLDKTGYGVAEYPGEEIDIRGCNTPEEYEKIVTIS